MSKLIAAVLHDVLTTKPESFATIADLADVLKHRCARLRIPYDCASVTDALHSVGRTRPLLEADR